LVPIIKVLRWWNLHEIRPTRWASSYRDSRMIDAGLSEWVESHQNKLALTRVGSYKTKPYHELDPFCTRLVPFRVLYLVVGQRALTKILAPCCLDLPSTRIGNQIKLFFIKYPASGVLL
jgi:hypothetical protein